MELPEEDLSALRKLRRLDSIMDTTTLLVIVLIVLVLFGGGYYGRGRWW
jgi:hypothetical protein